MRRRRESGFALLLVFLMAAMIGIGLYFEMPRVAFESQRGREQMAIDRANEYKRAIQLFYRKYKTYPQSLDDLETTRNMRFLRRRYMDPLTGKEWRLVDNSPIRRSRRRIRWGTIRRRELARAERRGRLAQVRIQQQVHRRSPGRLRRAALRSIRRPVSRLIQD